MQPLKAVEYVRRVRGGSQAHILGADDGRRYVVKLLGNPQSNKVLANDLLATRMAQAIGLPVPVPSIIEVDAEFIDRNPQLRFQLTSTNICPTPGLQFGSQLVEADQVCDFLPEQLPVKNPEDFHGILAFDKWTSQADGRQVVYSRRKRQRKWQATFIDFGYAFNLEWSFPDSPLRGVYARNSVYQHISGWHDFEPWLDRIEHFSATDLYTAAEDMPFEWYEDRQALGDLFDQLMHRRALVRELITSFRTSVRQPFPNWTDTPLISADPGVRAIQPQL
jgi:hypothetical protein